MPAVDSAEEQIALNETTFRDVNEAHRERARESARGSCRSCASAGELGCNAVVELTLHEYEGVRAGSRCFLVAPGHGASFDESSARTRAFTRRRQARGPLGDIAERTDPRKETA